MAPRDVSKSATAGGAEIDSRSLASLASLAAHILGGARATYIEARFGGADDRLGMGFIRRGYSWKEASGLRK